ncbi:MAG TPA: hypothetical protein GXX59_04190 [Syntrophomonadaceae bacterium]|nr:hypothetical protein [Syntrophomonadaceae bacterium]
MALTPRQKEFLSRLCDHFAKVGTPVHYTTVAKWMGVSKWTAYDMLKRLEQVDCLSSRYDVSVKGAPGRTQLLFVPGARIKQLLEPQNMQPCDYWLAWKKKLIEPFEKLRSDDYGHSLIDELIALLPEAQSPTMYCACLIALLVACLKTFNEQAIKFIQQTVDHLNNPEQRLSLFSGAVAGSLFREARTSGHYLERDGLLTGLIDKFHKHLEHVDMQHSLLAGLLDDLMHVAIC